MSRTRGLWTLASLCAVLWLAPPARAAWIVVPPRPGQVGLGLSGLYDLMPTGGSLADQFDNGPGFAVRVRYRMRFERGFGLTFETQTFGARGDFHDPQTDSTYAAGTPFAADHLRLFLYGVDYYQMFGTRTKSTRMVSVGAGIAHPIVSLNDGETTYPWSDGLYVSAGAGLERFFWQSWAYDLGARYHAIIMDGKVNHDLQVSLGLVFYASL